MKDRMNFSSQTERPEFESHYSGLGIEPVTYILSNELGFCEGNIIKYVSRYKQKNGLQDLIKARRYLDILISKHNE
jgi:hypothetical protein